ncbi:MAG TPA: RodZ domain-containing protein [Acidimicrobiales bacterium]|jgi:hypothetical protein|nr:RodZ domain-containing protein [Acidimicrobiales bacterium]
MTLLIVLAAIATVAATVVARQIATRTSDRRSVERYERSLDHLGGVTRRSDLVSNRTTTDSEIAPVHLGPLSHALPSAVTPVASTRPVAPPPAAALHPEATLIFGDEDLLPRKREPAAAPSGGLVHRPERSTVPSSTRPHRVSARVSLVALVVVALAVIGGTLLVSNGSKSPPSTVASNRSNSTKDVTSSTVTTTTVAPDIYTPTTVSPSLVTYGVPNRAHTLSFACTGACWVGVESSTSGPYLWMDTIGAGSKATYTTSKNVVVRIGAPSVSSMTLDGVRVAFPKQQVGAFDVVLAASPRSAAHR